MKHYKKKSDKNESKTEYKVQDALNELDEIKAMVLDDTEGKAPDYKAALKAIENKVKVAGLCKNEEKEAEIFFRMKEITIDGEPLKTNVGENLEDDKD